MKPDPHSTRRYSRLALIFATTLLCVIVALLCLIPKPENDLFWELRTGTDILRLHHFPRVDSYSWVRRGAEWDVPEWLAFSAYALAYQCGGFFGDYLLLTALTTGTALVVWFWAVSRVGVPWAFLLTNLMLLAMSDCLQTRPYAFSYFFLAVTLVLLMRARLDPIHTCGLLWLPAICVVWTNCHQGVLVLVCVLLVYSFPEGVWASERPPLGDGGRSARRNSGTAPWTRPAAIMLTLAAACACAVMVSPYGWRVYSNVYVTMDNPMAMANVTEWNSATALSFDQLKPFLLMAVIAFGSLAASPRRSLADAVALLALFVESVLHARNIAIFAIGSVVIAAPHFGWAAESLRTRFGLSSELLTPPARGGRQESPAVGALLTVFALVYTITVGMVAWATLLPALGAHGVSARNIGEAVVWEPEYPSDACAFVVKEGFPRNLRILNNFSIGGYLIWRLPSEPVFTDGRLDLYAGRPFADMLTLSRDGGSPAWLALVRSYNFDCVITTSASQARAFAADPDWQLVYTDLKRPHHYSCRIFLLRSRFPALIARCLRDRPLQSS